MANFHGLSVKKQIALLNKRNNQSKKKRREIFNHLGIEPNVQKRNTSEYVDKLDGHESVNSFSESLKNSTEKINVGNVLNGKR